MATQSAIGAACQPEAGTEAEDQYLSCEADCGHNVWGKPSANPVCGFCLIGNLKLLRSMTDHRWREMRAADAQAPVVVISAPSMIEPLPFEPVKRKCGRPKGSKNKPKSVVRANEAA